MMVRRWLLNKRDRLTAGLEFHQAGDLDAAESHYREHLASHEDDARALHLLGVLLAQRGVLAEACQRIERAVVLDAANPAMLVDLGNVRMLLGQAREAIDAYRKATAMAPDDPIGWGNLARALVGQGDVDGAVHACQRGLARQPADADTVAGFAATLRACGARREAESACRDALKLAPEHIAARQVLGDVLLDDARVPEALACFRAVVDAQPDNPFAQISLGMALERSGDGDAAITACTKAVRLAPAEPQVHEGLASVLWRTRRLDEAVRAYRQAIALDATRLEPRANLAALLESMSRLDEAAEEAAAGLTEHPADPYLNLVLAQCERRAGDREAARRRLARIDSASAPLDLQARIQYELGQLHDALGDPRRAFEAFRAANAKAATSPEARTVSKTRYLGEIAAAEVIVPQLQALAGDCRAPTARDCPAFIVGFPRSGTTLSDQILDSHPAARTLSEKPAVDRIVQQLAELGDGYPASLMQITPQRVAALREAYRAIAGTFVEIGSGELLVDRNPLNLVRLPAIWRLFPRARIVFALRHPCDAVLSCYMQHFSYNDAMVSFLDLEDAARLYDAVMSLWRTCTENLTLEVHVLKYESLVESFEAEVRALLAFLELPWSDSVLDFAGHARARADINTPSYHQVTRAIYTDARERWRRYAEPLAPVLPLLAPWVEYFGYGAIEGQ